MDDVQFADLASRIGEIGLSGQDETAMVTGLCAQLVERGMPLVRAQVFIDTLHPTHAGRVYLWKRAKGETVASEYGPATEGEALERWKRSPFFYMLETGAALLRRRLTKERGDDFSYFGDLHAAGMTEYVAVINRFGEDAVIGEMDCVYSSWVTSDPEGFTDAQVAALQRLTPSLALTIKSATLVRIAKTLVETYLGRDAGRRVLKGSIARGSAVWIPAVLWFSDLHDYTRICDHAQPQDIIPLLNDYAEAVNSAIYGEGGDFLKLIGDGTLAMFAADDTAHACRSALVAAQRALDSVGELKEKRRAKGMPATDLYLGLHFGEVVYGNFGSLDRLDFTVVGPAVNEVSRIAAMCRMIDQPILVSSSFFSALGQGENRLVSVGRYALRGVDRPQDLFTIERAALA
jgi:adenylate cyclase